jgi:hypothetical protein
MGKDYFSFFLKQGVCVAQVDPTASAFLVLRL